MSDPVINSDEHFMELALKQAHVAGDKGEVPVGAVLVVGGRVVAEAYNSRETSGDPTAHAEVLVLREGAAKGEGWRLTEATLYVTKEPCVMCAGSMLNARLGRLVYGCSDSKGGALSIYGLLTDGKLNHKVDVLSGVLEEKCSGLLRDFFSARRGG